MLDCYTAKSLGARSKNATKFRNRLHQRFSNHGSQPKCGSPTLCGWVAKACKLPRVKEKNLRTEDFRSEKPSLRDHYDFKTKINKSESDSR